MGTKLLVIDDDPNICDLLKFYFENEGYEVKTAGDGIEGISYFKMYEPDLVLLDIMMPRKDGWQLCREIRAADQFLYAIHTVCLRNDAEDRGACGEIPFTGTRPACPKGGDLHAVFFGCLSKFSRLLIAVKLHIPNGDLAAIAANVVHLFHFLKDIRIGIKSEHNAKLVQIVSPFVNGFDAFIIQE